MIRVIRALLITLAVLGCTNAAHAAKTECPKKAVQTLYNLKLKVYGGQEKDPEKIFAWANQAMQQCSDNATVMAQAAELFQIVGDGVPMPKNQFVAYSKAYQAVLNNGKAWDGAAQTPKVRNPDGSEKTLYTYNTASIALGKIISGLAELNEKNHPRSIFNADYSSRQPCPHISSGRVLKEGEALRERANMDGRKLLTAVHRVNGLYLNCPDYRPGLSYYLTILNSRLADYYASSKRWAKALDHVTKAQKFYDEYYPHAADYSEQKSYLLPTKLAEKRAKYQSKIDENKEN